MCVGVSVAMCVAWVSAGPASATKKPSKRAPIASTVVPIAFDAPGTNPRPLRETTVIVDKATDTLAMTITGISYRGIVCGFSLRGVRPAPPVTIRLSGTTSAGSFDSGAVAVSWTPTAKEATAGAAESHGWSFSAEGHPNRGGPGWVVSIGGVTSPGPSAVPTGARCELRASRPVFVPAAGPVGYWAGFATV